MLKYIMIKEEMVLPSLVDRLVIDMDNLRNQMYRLDDDAQARITELKDLVAEANELGMIDAADMFNKQLEKVERVIRGVRGDLSELSKEKEKMIEEIENERRKKLRIEDENYLR